MSGPRPGAQAPVLVLGAPGTGCSSIAAALGALLGAPVHDLGALTAAALGVSEATALVSAGEVGYRRAEREQALAVLERPLGVLALGSGCLTDTQVVEALDRAVSLGARTVLLTASVRRLATRNGLDAPRSVALGNVHHAFTVMLRERERACREAAGEQAVVVDTTDTTPGQAAQAAKRALAG